MKKPTPKSLKKKAWKLVSEFVRRRSANWKGEVSCFTCGAIKNWKETHCGHWKHGKLDYDTRNLKPQCKKCNVYLHGNLDRYTLRLIEENNIEWIKRLEQDANQVKKYTIKELEEIIERYTKWLKAL